MWLVVIFCCCLNLLGLGSTQTIFAIFAITAPALDLSYVAVILAHRVYEHRVPFIAGPYTLGKWSPLINGIAIAWVVFISVVLFFPPISPVTFSNMNYAICVAGVVGIISLSWWFISARQYVNLVSQVYRPNANLCTVNTPGRAPKKSSSKFHQTTRIWLTRIPLDGEKIARARKTHASDTSNL